MVIRTQDSSILNRLTNEGFHKRKESLMRKSNDLRIYCQADVYILLYRKGRFYVDTFTDNPAWPSTPEAIVGYFICLTLGH